MMATKKITNTSTDVSMEKAGATTAPTELGVFAQQILGVLRTNAMTCDQLSTYYSIKYGRSLPDQSRGAAGSNDKARLEALKTYLAGQAELFEFQADRVKAAANSRAEGLSSLAAGWTRQTSNNPIAAVEEKKFPEKKPALPDEIEKEKNVPAVPAVEEPKKRMAWADIESDIESDDEDLADAPELIEEKRLDSFFERLDKKREQLKKAAASTKEQQQQQQQPAVRQAPPEPKREPMGPKTEKEVRFVVDQLAELLKATGHPVAHSSVLCSQFMHKHSVSVSDAAGMKPMELFRTRSETFVWLSSGNVSLREFENDPAVKQQLRLLQERPKQLRVEQAAREAQLPAPTNVTEKDVVMYFQRLIAESGAGSMYVSALCGRFMQRFKQPVTAVVGCKPVDFFKKHPREFVMEMGGHVRLGCPVPELVLQEMAAVAEAAPQEAAQADGMSCEQQPAFAADDPGLAEQPTKKKAGKAAAQSTTSTLAVSANTSESASTTASSESGDDHFFATPPQSPILRAKPEVAAAESKPPAKQHPWRRAAADQPAPTTTEQKPAAPEPRTQYPWRMKKAGAATAPTSPPAAPSALSQFSEDLKVHCCRFFQVCQMVLDVGLWVEASDEYPDEAELVLFVESLSRAEMPKMLNSVEEMIRTHMTAGEELRREGNCVCCVVQGTGTHLRIFLAPSYPTTDALRQAVRASKAARDRSVLQPAFAKERQAFFEKHAGLGSLGRSAAVFLKTWSSRQLWSSKFTTPPTYLLRLIAAHAARQYELDGQGCQGQEDRPWANGLRSRVLEACANFEILRVLWADKGMANYSLSEVPEFLLKQQPLLLDPVNCHHNVVDPSSFDGFELAKFAKAALRGS